MRPVTTSNFSRSGAASVRSGFVSIRTGTRTAASSIRPLTTSRSSQPSKLSSVELRSVKLSSKCCNVQYIVLY
jgi:hypothetical protein